MLRKVYIKMLSFCKDTAYCFLAEGNKVTLDSTVPEKAARGEGSGGGGGGWGGGGGGKPGQVTLPEQQHQPDGTRVCL